MCVCVINLLMPPLSKKGPSPLIVRPGYCIINLIIVAKRFIKSRKHIQFKI